MEGYKPDWKSARDFDIIFQTCAKIFHRITGRNLDKDIKSSIDSYRESNANGAQNLWGVGKNTAKVAKKAKYILDVIVEYNHHNKQEHTGSNSVFLDIGCGGGDLCSVVSETTHERTKVICADIANHTHKKLEFILITPGAPLAIADNSIDFVSAQHVLHHMQDIDSRLADIARIVKPGGYLFIKDHDIRSYSEMLAVEFEHIVYEAAEGKPLANNLEYRMYYSADDVISAMKALGFEVVSYEDAREDSRSINLTRVYHVVLRKE